LRLIEGTKPCWGPRGEGPARNYRLEIFGFDEAQVSHPLKSPLAKEDVHLYVFPSLFESGPAIEAKDI
jgi:hypothetical protein